eukprot:CAMPEP_0194260900 /NCGR_PEP_ID=MMETSP0158-20130606/45747_1 /TAXON_ID=33649 /ORGANISM="Thalassionema nitzschioides, Strain L26-B" /LENGTH=411 /DNA_ID=CAMNT_0039001005 /DNA_START=403 /DNA_END=1640 /DNA_ORIENTATION=-
MFRHHLFFILATVAPTITVAFISKPLSRPSFALSAEKKKIFIDGEAGTTGLQVRDRLAGRDDLEIISIPDELRKDASERKKYVNEADAVILCLPDDASIEAASWVEPDNDRTVLIDASTAFRVDDNWTYGFPELSPKQKEDLKKSTRISNPGCYPTGFIGLTRPLVDAGILPAGTPLTVNAISGYTGGGKGLMAIFEEGDHEPWSGYGFGLDISGYTGGGKGLMAIFEEGDHEPWSGYGFGLVCDIFVSFLISSTRAGLNNLLVFNKAHKHIPEMGKYSGLGTKPIFQPQIGSFAQGMVVSVPLHYAWLKEGTTGADIHAALSKHYEESTFISVMPYGENAVKEADLFERGAFLRPDTLANTNKMQLFVFANDDAGQALLCARLDNLGKGASGAAVQNLNLALGLEESIGL